MDEMRALKPPTEGAVMFVTGGPLRDIARVGLEPFGPFQSHDDFHQFLRANHPLAAFEMVDKMINSHRQRYATKFTHGDFTPRNIMVKRNINGTITAIVDWDCAGWFPEYWNTQKPTSITMQPLTGWRTSQR
jgi:hypothetical protein